MAFDLRAAFHKKGEVESARLDDFDYRWRARTMRLLAAELGRPEAELVGAIAHADDQTILAGLGDVGDRYARCQAEARRMLIAERGDPTPHRLA